MYLPSIPKPVILPKCGETPTAPELQLTPYSVAITMKILGSVSAVLIVLVILVVVAITYCRRRRNRLKAQQMSASASKPPKTPIIKQLGTTG